MSGLPASDQVTEIGVRGKYLLKLGETLGLTETQISQIKTIIQTSVGQFQSIENDNSLEQAQKAAQLTALKQNVDQQINSVLTPEQQRRIAAFIRQFQHWGGHRKQAPSCDYISRQVCVFHWRATFR